MEEQKNIAEYHPGKFTMDLSLVDWNKENQPTDESFPIYAHEYSHYIQDISTISGIAGFYYAIIDIVELTTITCAGDGKIIKIPIQQDSKGMPIKKHKSLYSYYCGDVTTHNDIYKIDLNSKETTEISVGNHAIKIPVYRLKSTGHEDILVGTYAIQEAHAYYIQKIIETDILTNKKDLKFKIPVDTLPQYPYKFVDYLFEVFGIESTIKLKAYITELCLDTFLPIVTIIKVLKVLQAREKIEDKTRIYDLVSVVISSLEIPPASKIQRIIVDFLENIIADRSRPSLSKGITWYLNTIINIRELRNKRVYWIHDALISSKLLKGFMSFYQPPIIIINDQISYFNSNLEHSGNSQVNHDSAIALFLYLHMFSFITEINKDKFSKLVECPFFKQCEVRQNIQSDYICKTSPWKISELHKEEGKVCYYQSTLQELGLKQNKIDLDINLIK